MSLDQRKVVEAADFLAESRASGQRRTLPDHLRPTNEDEAFAIAEELRRRGVKGGIGGWKIGAAEPTARGKMGISQPFSGVIDQDHVVQSPATLRHSELMRPILEAEFAFRIGKDLGPFPAPLTMEQVVDAIDALVIGIEIPESRLDDDHGLGPLAVVTDFGGSGRYVIGQATEDWVHAEFLDQEVVLTVNGVEKGRGTARQAVGKPAEALTWFVNKLSAAGETLHKGTFISTGSCTGIVPARAGDHVVADFGPFGTVEVTFA